MGGVSAPPWSLVPDRLVRWFRARARQSACRAQHSNESSPRAFEVCFDERYRTETAPCLLKSLLLRHPPSDATEATRHVLKQFRLLRRFTAMHRAGCGSALNLARTKSPTRSSTQRARLTAGRSQPPVFVTRGGAGGSMGGCDGQRQERARRKKGGGGQLQLRLCLSLPAVCVRTGTPPRRPPC